MTDSGAQSPSFPPGSTADFFVIDNFGQTDGRDGLVRAPNGAVFFIQLIFRPNQEGGHISTILVPQTPVTFTVERSFASGYLILATLEHKYFATPVAAGGA